MQRSQNGKDGTLLIILNIIIQVIPVLMILVYSKMFFWGFPGGSGGLGLTPGLERSPGEGNGYPPQYS